MAKKFYGVKNGHKVGVYDNWSDCQKQINGFSGAEYKGFPTKAEAEAYILGTDVVTTVTKEKSNSSKENIDMSDFMEVYVDGSFMNESIGYGVVFVKNDEAVFKDCGRVPTKDLTERNVTGEIYATIRTIQMCVANDIKNIVICYDYQGIEKWAKKEWKANKPLTKRYVEYFDKYTKEKDLCIQFRYTPAHTGIKWNEEADRLAKLGTEL